MAVPRRSRTFLDSPRSARAALRGTLAFFACIVVPQSSDIAFGSTMRADRDPQASLDLAQQPAYAGVGLLDVDIFESGPAAIGSGTLVAPGWVLTAAHVLEDAKAVQFNLNGQVYSATRWISYPKYNGDLIRGYDLALVQLDRPVDGVTPAKLYTGHSELGQTATFVGYGVSGTGLTGAITDDRQKRAVTNVIDGTARHGKRNLVLSEKLPRNARHFVVDFDNPTDPTDNRIGSATPTDLEGLISRGDSGGPVFLDDPAGGLPLLAGIHSYGQFFDDRDDSDYGDLTGHTRVSPFASWIDKITAGRRTGKLRFVAPVVSGTDAFPMRLEPDAQSTFVPEPACLTGFATCAIGLLSRRRRAHHRAGSNGPP